MVHDPVDDRCGQLVVGEDRAPFRELDVRGEDDAPSLVALRYEDGTVARRGRGGCRDGRGEGGLRGRDDGEPAAQGGVGRPKRGRLRPPFDLEQEEGRVRREIEAGDRPTPTTEAARQENKQGNAEVYERADKNLGKSGGKRMNENYACDSNCP